MAARVTIDRTLRDDDDDSGQTVREWKIEAEPGGLITIRKKHGTTFIMLRPSDVELFVVDLNRAKEVCKEEK